MPGVSQAVKLLQALKAQIKAVEADQELQELEKVITDPREFAVQELKDSGIVILGIQELSYPEIGWTRAGAKYLRYDMHYMQIVNVQLPNGKQELRCGFGYPEGVALHGTLLVPMSLNVCVKP